MSIDLSGLDATAQADLVRKGDVSAVELVEAAVSRIEKVNPELNAVITPLFDKARAQAGGKLEPGPFRGVPFLLKDLGATSAGDPLHSGMQLMKKLGFVAPDDTYLTRKFREAGFILLGKTNTPEIGLAATTEPLAYGPTRNPWNRAHSAGGSSGGSAAAVSGDWVSGDTSSFYSLGRRVRDQLTHPRHALQRDHVRAHPRRTAGLLRRVRQEVVSDRARTRENLRARASFCVDAHWIHCYSRFERPIVVSKERDDG